MPLPLKNWADNVTWVIHVNSTKTFLVNLSKLRFELAQGPIGFMFSSGLGMSNARILDKFLAALKRGPVQLSSQKPFGHVRERYE